MSADSFSERPLFGGAISTTFPPTFQEKNYRKGRFCPSKIKGKRCFELGAGCGVAGFGRFCFVQILEELYTDFSAHFWRGFWEWIWGILKKFKKLPLKLSSHLSFRLAREKIPKLSPNIKPNLTKFKSSIQQH